MLKWEITFHEKPQGLWRPKVSIRFWVEGEEWKILNINPVFKCKEVLDWLKYSSCSFCSSCLKQYPLPVYSSVFPSNTEAFCFLKSYIDLNCLPCQLDFFIEVRPAKNYHDDYADYIEFLQNICLSFVKEYEKRINYARECSELSQMVISGNYLIQQQCKTDIKTKATRKIKV